MNVPPAASSVEPDPESVVRAYRRSSPNASVELRGDKIAVSGGTEIARAKLKRAIEADRSAVFRFLNKKCNRCQSTYYITSYWLEPLCQECCHVAAKEFDQKGAWPRGPVDKETVIGTDHMDESNTG